MAIRTDSTAFRFLAVSLIATAAILLLLGILLTNVFRSTIVSRFDHALEAHLFDLVAAVEPNENDAGVTLVWRPGDPRFNAPHSGWYWQVVTVDTVVARSQSLVSGNVPLWVPQGEQQDSGFINIADSNEVPLRAKARRILFENRPPMWFIVTGPISDVENEVSRFRRQLTIALVALAVALLLLIAVQLHVANLPGKRMRREIGEVRKGNSAQLSDNYPTEMQPIANEINALIEHNQLVLERARLQSGNLAHALKTPLAIVRNAIGDDTPERQVMLQQLSKIDTTVKRQMHYSANAVGSLSQQSCDVKTAIDDLVFAMQSIHAPKKLAISGRVDGSPRFAGSLEDFDELVGNLLDNACKWANGRVEVAASAHENYLSIIVTDDGPGIPHDMRAAIFRPGQRLDESVPGWGLGLFIVRDLVALYNGSLALLSRDAGESGTRIRLRLPLSNANDDHHGRT
ncbi:ATP-binding protein [Gammaproteobacteria bacterium]|nr:ATP-binding protein [Gammaproteobacteria bacterium]